MIENMSYLGECSMVANQAMQKTTRQIVCMALVLLMLFASTPGSAADQQKGGSFSVDTSIEGGWFFPPTAGQGFLFDLIEGDQDLLFVAWFTFESDANSKIGAGEHRWLTAIGPVNGSTAELTITSTTGGAFDQGGGTSGQEVGSMTIEFSSCRQAQLSYQLDGTSLSGTIPLEPVDPSRANCEQASKVPAVIDKGVDFIADDGVQGGWFFPATSGQGFMVDYIEGNPAQLFVAWFSFENNASGQKIGGTGQRWFTALGPLTDGKTAEMTLLSTSGGLFDQASTVTNDTVGTLIVDFSTCKQATMSYEFDNSSLSGTIPIEPVDPSRANCDQVVAPAADPPQTCEATGMRLFDGSVITEEIKPAIDADYYRIVLAATASISASTSGDLDTVGRLHDANCDALASDDNSGPGDNFNFSMADLDAGTYFISVRSSQDDDMCIGLLCKPTYDATGPYALSVDIEFDQVVAPVDQFPDTCDLNDSPLLGAGESIAGIIDPGSDLDFFRINITDNNSEIRAFSTSNLDLTGRIYDAGCNRIVSDNNSGAGSNFDVMTVLDSGTYYVSVGSSNGTATGDYQLSVEIEPAFVSVDDFPNTCSLNGIVLGDGSSITGSIETPEDLDFFRVDVASNDIALRAFTNGGLDTVGRIFDAACTEIAFNDDTEFDTNFDVVQAIDAGTYYVSVESFANASAGDYRLNIELTSVVGIGDDFPNSCDLNGSPLLGDGDTIAGSLEVPDDLDFFRIDVSQSNTTIRALSTGNTDTIGSIYDNNCQELAFNDDSVFGLNFEVTTIVEPGTYYVSVGSFAASSTGDYRLNIEVGAGFGVNDDFPNTCDFNSAPIIGNGSGRAGVIDPASDRDFFRVDVNVSGTTLRAFTTGEMDTVGQVYDSGCNAIASNDDFFDLNFDVAIAGLTPGTYYVSVESFAGSETGNYTLNIELDESGLEIDSFPNTCDFDSASLLSDGSTISGTINPRIDTDFFRVEVSNSATLRAFTTSNMDTIGGIFDSDCNQFDGDDDGGQDLNFDLSTSVAPGTYFIGLGSFDSQTVGEYTLNVEIN